MGSETEGRLQVDAANGHASGERATLKTIVFVEEWRSQNSARIGQVHLVEYVARRSTQRKVVTTIGTAAPEVGATAEQWTARTTAAAPGTASAATTPARATLVARATLYLGAESEALA